MRTPSPPPAIIPLNPAIEALIRPPRGSLLAQNPPPPSTQPPEYKKGGKIRKTGFAKLHKGELVIPASRVTSVEKAVKMAGMKPLKK